MKALVAIIIVLVATWVQVAWFGHVRPWGVMPNVMLVVVVLYGLWSDATPALAVALGGGFLLDLSSGSDFGLRMGVFAVVVLALVAGRQLGLQADLLVTGLAAGVIGTLLYDAVVLATLQTGINGVVASRIGRELVDNLGLLVLAYIVRLNLHHRPPVLVPDRRLRP